MAIRESHLTWPLDLQQAVNHLSFAETLKINYFSSCVVEGNIRCRKRAIKKQHTALEATSSNTLDNSTRMLVSLAYAHARDSSWNVITLAAIVILQHETCTTTCLAYKVRINNFCSCTFQIFHLDLPLISLAIATTM